jgi:hypothetical protein
MEKIVASKIVTPFTQLFLFHTADFIAIATSLTIIGEWTKTELTENAMVNV